VTRLHLLTGAGSGIGREIARRLLERGDGLVLLVRDPAKVADLADLADSAGRTALTVVTTDLADPAAVEALAPPERLDSVIHCAGAVELGPVAQLGPEAWETQLQVNLVGPALLTRRTLPAVRATRGTVVFVNSGAGLRANPDWAAYAASKHGLKALADALREEERPHGVRVTSVYPGRTASPMQAKVHEQEGRAYDPAAWIQPGTVAEAVLHVLDLPGDASIPDLSVRPR